jgi:hypothetical protein
MPLGNLKKDNAPGNYGPPCLIRNLSQGCARPAPARLIPRDKCCCGIIGQTKVRYEMGALV